MQDPPELLQVFGKGLPTAEHVVEVDRLGRKPG